MHEPLIGDPNCPKCRGSGTSNIVHQKSPTSGQMIEVGIPCECVLLRKAKAWLNSILIQLDESANQRFRADPKILSKIKVKSNVVIDGNMPGCLWYFKEALKAHCASVGLSGFVRFFLFSDKDECDYHWSSSKEDHFLKRCDWSQYELAIITLGNISDDKKNSYNWGVVASRISNLVHRGLKVWVALYDETDVGADINRALAPFSWITLSQEGMRRGDKPHGDKLRGDKLRGALEFRSTFKRAEPEGSTGGSTGPSGSSSVSMPEMDSS